MPSSHLVIWAISFVSIALMLLRPRKISEVWWVCGGAIALILFHLISLATAWHAIAEGTDVYLFLTGMMLLAQLAQTHGVFDWLATVAIQKARGAAVSRSAPLYVGRKPNSVPPRLLKARRRWSFISDRDCSRPAASRDARATDTRDGPRSFLRDRAGDPASLFGLAPHGVYRAPEVARRAVGSYPAFSPLPRDPYGRREAVCSL